MSAILHHQASIIVDIILKWLPVKSIYRPIFPSYILISQKKRYVRNSSRNIHYNTCEGDTQLFSPFLEPEINLSNDFGSFTGDYL